MKQFLVVAMCAALAACGANNSDNRPARSSDTKQEPSNYAPGVHIGGHAQVGVKATF